MGHAARVKRLTYALLGIQIRRSFPRLLNDVSDLENGLEDSGELMCLSSTIIQFSKQYCTYSFFLMSYIHSLTS